MIHSSLSKYEKRSCCVCTHLQTWKGLIPGFHKQPFYAFSGLGQPEPIAFSHTGSHSWNTDTRLNIPCTTAPLNHIQLSHVDCEYTSTHTLFYFTIHHKAPLPIPSYLLVCSWSEVSWSRIQQSLTDGLSNALFISAVGVIPLLRTVALAAGHATESPGRWEESVLVSHQMAELASELPRKKGLIHWDILGAGLA